ncbi:MAG: DEAD/DEAH box helicase family protein [Desulfobacter sp.]|nr:MAG: DEAD/DEAH box helicase family protein [Desulfobacter sp.]
MTRHTPVPNSAFRLTPGQRWMSETEPELGMGLLVSHDKRRIIINFPGGECTRQYSMGAAPIRRTAFKPGDRITTMDGQERVVDAATESNGVLTYTCGTATVNESELSPFMAVSLPKDRLLSGLAGPSALFELRKDIRFCLSRYQTSPARGFLGGQVDLIPHQLYIAGEVSNRYFPRVMLSDETGLGKTIEAGLIIHRLLVTGRIQRVLIIVPDALVHQWFIELYRKFNFKFRLFNEEYCLDARRQDQEANPFSGDQQGICSQSFIRDNPKLHQMIMEAGWDMVVMDEAHHITESPDFYQFMQGLGRQTRGLMLLSATPEQMGPDSHFAQLRLLDPDRYYDPRAYAREAKGYEETAARAKADLDRGRSVDGLLDSFGPGRVVFRNRRAAIKGFPDRKVILTPLDGSPSTGSDLSQDPRVIHLAELAREIKPEKILVICATAETAEAVHRGVQAHISIDSTRFDETMTLLQRDRQAAWFAREDGARLLICSEIGSEGRNFQFVSRLFLFDLPENPELLEQRIGRVDRIGQKHDIRLHVPYIRGTEQEVLARWYAHGLPLLERNINGIHAIFSRFAPRLSDLGAQAREGSGFDENGLNALIEEASVFTAGAQAALDRGKHILLELNSFRPGPAGKLVDAVAGFDRDPALPALMETLLDHYGVDMDYVSDQPGQQIISLTMDRMADEAFPTLPRGSEIVTFDRATAIAREELSFLTWDHPFVNQVVDFLLTRGEGTAAVAVYDGDMGPGLFLESLYLLEIPGIENHPDALGFIPTDPIHILLNHMGETPRALPGDFYDALRPERPGWFMDMEGVKEQLLPELLEKSLGIAEQKAEAMRGNALKSLNRTLGREIERLRELKKVNPDITAGEIRAAEEEREILAQCLEKARIRLDGVRLIRSE